MFKFGLTVKLPVCYNNHFYTFFMINYLFHSKSQLKIPIKDDGQNHKAQIQRLAQAGVTLNGDVLV